MTPASERYSLRNRNTEHFGDGTNAKPEEKLMANATGKSSGGEATRRRGNEKQNILQEDSQHPESHTPKKRKKPYSVNDIVNAKPPQKRGRKGSTTSKQPVEEASLGTTKSKSKSTLPTLAHPSLKNPIPYQEYNPAEPPSEPLPPLIFTHGAGGGLSAPAVVNFCSGYASSRPVLAFEGSMNLTARVKGFHACLDEVRGQAQVRDKGGNRVFVLGGRSMGARAAIMAALEILFPNAEKNLDENMNAEPEQGVEISLILVSYPLKGPKDIRDDILLRLPSNVNVLFVIGERDAMCPLHMLKEVMGKMRAKTSLAVVEGLDHGMNGKGGKELGKLSGKLAAQWIDGERWDDERVLRLEEQKVN